jgi:type VI secretion system ImpA family protein
VLREFAKAIGTALPDLAKEDLYWRLDFTAGALTYAMADFGLIKRPAGVSEKAHCEKAAQALIRFAADTGLRSAASSETRLKEEAVTPMLASPQEANVHANAQPGHSGPLRSRAEAIAQLRAVAEFFRRTEPHSPVTHLADKAAQWGEMPLHAWLKTVIKDNAALSHVEELLGLQAPQAE